MKPWHLRDPAAFARERADVERAYPHLRFSVDNSRITIKGSIAISDDRGVLDRFFVEIQIDEPYPDLVPRVYEVGDRIPRTRDRHCYDDTGSACLFLLEERWKIWPVGSTLKSLLDGPVCNYFISQAVFERDGEWPFDEWAHGFLGQKQYYKETFGTDDPVKARKYFDYLVSKKVKPHWPCACGSGRELRACHFALLRTLRARIPRREAKRGAARLRDKLEELRRPPPAAINERGVRDSGVSVTVPDDLLGK